MVESRQVQPVGVSKVIVQYNPPTQKLNFCQGTKLLRALINGQVLTNCD